MRQYFYRSARFIPLFVMLSGFHSAASSADSSDSVQSASGKMILVVGAGGTPEYGDEFAKWADRWNQVAARSGIDVISIGRDSASQSDRDQLATAIESIDKDGATPLWIVFLGHGTFSRNVAKFNLRGRDVSAEELAGWLKPFERTVVVVNCASSSGPFINRLSAENRVIVTATKSGIEQNYARFGKYFSEAVSSADSDLDHDDEVSVHEAFLKASSAVQQFYDAEARISTEHALIDDNGDGKGTPAKMYRGTRPIAEAKDGSELDGKRASRITLALADDRLRLTADEIERRAEIEQQLDRLRRQKDVLSEQEYESKLEPLLIEMARLYQAAEQRTTQQRAATDQAEGPDQVAESDRDSDSG